MSGVEKHVSLQNVRFAYEGSRSSALDGLDLGIGRAETILLSGPAGAGKTTVCRTMNGLVPFFFSGTLEGKIQVEGRDVSSYGSVGGLAHLVGYVGQDPQSQLFCPTVEDEIAFGLENAGLPAEETARRVEEVLRLTGLERYRSKEPHSLSGGEQQKCAIAAFLAMNQGIMLLDEPTSNIDPLGSVQVFELVGERIEKTGTTCAIVEHKLDVLCPMVDRLVVLQDGKVAMDGHPRQVLREAQKLAEIGLRPPQTVQLASRLEAGGVLSFKELPLTVEELVAELRRLPLRRPGKVPSFRASESRRRRTGKTAIAVEGLAHVYPDGTEAIKGLDLEVKEGEFIGIIGQNGSGKTTLVKHFNGLLRPTRGRVTVYGMDTRQSTPDRLSQTVGYCFQNPDNQIFCNTVREEIAFGPRNLGVLGRELEERVSEAAARVEIDRHLGADPYSLSLGERLRVAVASILAMRPRVLIVDEPTTGQDYRRGNEIMGLIAELNRTGTTVIVITHDMQLCAEWVDRVIVVRDGRILLDGSTREVFARPDVLRETYLTPPQVALVGQALKDVLPDDALRVEEMYQAIRELVDGKGAGSFERSEA